MGDRIVREEDRGRVDMSGKEGGRDGGREEEGGEREGGW